MNPASPRSAFAALLVAALTAGLSPVVAQTNPDSGRRRGGDAGGSGGSGGDRGDRGGRGNFDPQEMQQRMLSSLRERLEVTDDAEWKLISERVMKVSELRRTTGGGMGGMMFGGRGGPGGPGGGGDRTSGGGGGDRGPGRGGPRPGGNPEMDLLSSALRDKLPDAEVKARLDRYRESRKNTEARLAKAQEDLRAVLSVRQEAIAVVFGLLP